AGDAVYLLGGAGSGLAGSEYAALFGVENAAPPRAVDAAAHMALYRLLHAGMKEKLFRSVHDVSEGGAFVAAAESAVGGRLGFALDGDLGAETLFNESAGRFVVS